MPQNRTRPWPRVLTIVVIVGLLLFLDVALFKLHVLDPATLLLRGVTTAGTVQARRAHGGGDEIEL